jgi:hypothetical protein
MFLIDDDNAALRDQAFDRPRRQYFVATHSCECDGYVGRVASVKLKD